MHFHGLFAKPTVLNLIVDLLAGRKCAKLDSAQAGFSKRHLCSVVAANHAFLLVSIDVPDHTFHASDSCSFPKGLNLFPSSMGATPLPLSSPAQSEAKERPTHGAARGAIPRLTHLLLQKARLPSPASPRFAYRNQPAH